MGVTFVLGRAGTGKTRACLDDLLDAIEHAEGMRKLILLVPEQATFQMQRALAVGSARGGTWQAEVLSFSRLASRILDETGAPDELSSSARSLVLRRIIAAHHEKLRILRRVAHADGLYHQLDRLIGQFMMEGVHARDLFAAADRVVEGSVAEKTRELAIIMEVYLDWLGPERIDPAHRLAVLQDRLQRVHWLADTSIWVDGFAGFTAMELHALVSIAQRARDVTISLLVDPASPSICDATRKPDPLGLFERTEVTYQRLVRLLEDAGVKIHRPNSLAPPAVPRFRSARLATLEAGLATPVGVPLSAGVGAATPGDGVRIVECTTHRAELESAARWIRTTIAESREELHFFDFAVIARDLEPLAGLIAEVFAEYEIPFFLDRRRSVATHPVCRFMASLLDVVVSDFAIEPTVRLLRSDLLPIRPQQAEQLENLIVTESLRGRHTWEKASWELADGTLANAFFDDRQNIIAAIDPLVSLSAGGRAPARDWARAMHDALESLGVRDKVEQWIATARRTQTHESAETHRLAYEAVIGAIEDLHDILDDTPQSIGDVAGILNGTLRDQTLALAPPTLDQVLISAIERSRHPDIRHAWVCAFNEGIFPAPPAADTLLSTAERDALVAAGLDATASHREDALAERLLAYIAFSRPSHSLTISYATVDEDGESLHPSPLLDEVCRTLPDLSVERLRDDCPPVTVGELARGVLGRRYPADGSKALCDHVRQMPSLSGRLDYLMRGRRYNNAPDVVGNYCRSRDADIVWSTSPSEIETALQCPFKHFARYGVGLDPERGPRPVRWDLGTAAHEILADTTQRAQRSADDVAMLDDKAWESHLQQAIIAYQSGQPADLPDRRPDLNFLGGVLANLLRDVVLVHAERWRRGLFRPLLCEQSFGTKHAAGGFPPVRIATPSGGHVEIRGKIDRVDATSDGLLLVYDYKSTAGRVGGEFLTADRLQLFLYLLAAQQARIGDGATVAGVLLAPLYPDFDALKTQYVASADAAQQRMYLFRPRGLFSEQAARRLDRGLSDVASPVAAMKLKKDGAFAKASDTAAASDIDAYAELAKKTVVFAAESVSVGKIDIAPLVENRTLACRYCDYRAVCRFDRAFNQPRLAEATLPLRSAMPGGGGSA